MAYGTASGPDDIERYYTDIRGGRTPTPEHLQELQERYAAIGNVFPLLDTTRAQAEGIVDRLNADGGSSAFRAYLGMKHSEPFIPEAIAAMRADGVERAIGIVMAPHWSGMSVETYIERVIQATQDDGGGPAFTFVRTYHDHPAFIAFLTARVAEALSRLTDGRARERGRDLLRALAAGADARRRLRSAARRATATTSCRYRDGLQETADLVARALGLGDYLIAWQSAGRTNDPWWGPPIEDGDRGAGDRRAERPWSCAPPGSSPTTWRSCTTWTSRPAGSPSEAGTRFERTRMPNADPAYLDVLAEVVREHLAEVPAR